MRQIDPIKAEEEFRSKLREAGLVPPDGLDTSGKLVRVQVDGKTAGKKDGWYCYHGDGIPAGAWGDWHDGPDAWRSWCACDVGELSPSEYVAHKARLDAARAQRSEAEKQRRKDAQDEADRIWDEAKPCTAHPYLTKKGVKSYGLREYSKRLLVPIRDSEGQIHSVEFIDDAGGKMFLSGGRKAGCWYGLGEPGDVICIAEGYATAASIAEATGHYVACAFDCGNLASVSKQLREKHPTAKIIVCADDDQKTKGNPGRTSAVKAAKESGSLVAIPDLAGGGDFNDQHASRGLQSVADTIGAALASDNGPIDAADLFPIVLQEIRDRKEGRSKTTLHTGIKSVDAITGGLRRGYLTVIAGLPGSGKTAATLGVLAHNASHGVPCMFFSIEMDRIDIGVRMLSQNSGVTASVIFDEKSGLESAGLRWEDVESAGQRLGQTLLTLDDRPLALGQMVEQSHLWYARNVKAQGRETGLIAIDYLGLIKSDEGSDNRNREVAALVQGIKLLARSLRVPIILCAQLNRQAANRDGEPELSDLRDSGEIEAAADLVIFPYPWPRYVNLAGELTMKLPKEKQVVRDVWLIRKNRNGAKGAATVAWRPETMQYTAAAWPGELPPRDWGDQ
jgi:phage/plasmid primase-like uncharacterized protein